MDEVHTYVQGILRDLAKLGVLQVIFESDLPLADAGTMLGRVWQRLDVPVDPLIGQGGVAATPKGPVITVHGLKSREQATDLLKRLAEGIAAEGKGGAYPGFPPRYEALTPSFSASWRGCAWRATPIRCAQRYGFQRLGLWKLSSNQPWTGAVSREALTIAKQPSTPPWTSGSPRPGLPWPSATTGAYGRSQPIRCTGSAETPGGKPEAPQPKAAVTW
jgi:hypothetical protein